MSAPTSSRQRTIDDVLAQARARLVRLSAREAWDAVGRGALLVDIRPAAQRGAEGEVASAVVIERNVLEWRLDPASPHHIAEATGYDQQVIIVCSEGYTSSLAAAALADLGLHRATDVVGGFHAWKVAGLPTKHDLTGPPERAVTGACTRGCGSIRTGRHPRNWSGQPASTPCSG